MFLQAIPSLVITFEFYSFTAGDCLVNHKICHFLIRQDHGLSEPCQCSIGFVFI